jgi:hypothetical protein
VDSRGEYVPMNDRVDVRSSFTRETAPPRVDPWSLERRRGLGCRTEGVGGEQSSTRRIRVNLSVFNAFPKGQHFRKGIIFRSVNYQKINGARGLTLSRRSLLEGYRYESLEIVLHSPMRSSLKARKAEVRSPVVSGPNSAENGAFSSVADPDILNTRSDFLRRESIVFRDVAD